MNLFFESMKFLFSVIAAYVGIRAVVNSSKSAKLSADSVRIATESIRVTKEKELREQSPHLIALSESLEIPVATPIFKELPDYSFPQIDKLIENDTPDYLDDVLKYISNKENNKFFLLDEDKEKYYKQHLDLEKFVKSYLDNRFKFQETNHFISMLNSGKGTAVNIEYEFIFENIDTYSEYEFNSYPGFLTSSNTPTYKLKIDNINDTEPRIYVTDLRLTKDKYFFDYYDSVSEVDYIISPGNIVYLNVLPPGEKHNFPIPMIFSIITKHYILCNFFQNFYLNSPSDLARDHFRPYLEEKLEPPKGKLIIRYIDDELSRLNDISKNKIELIFSLSVKKTNINSNEGMLSNVFLETNYISSKKS